ncbi:hypothetical protein MBLNU457_4929t1 [Dothideomycetes sp. NU457]
MDAVSVQDANKIRVAMGLPPLPVPGEDAGLAFKKSNDRADDSDPDDRISTLDKRQAAAGDNWAKLEAERKAKLDREARKEAVRKQREAVAKTARLEGKALGDADEADLDTATWLKQQKKRQKALEQARRYEEEQAAREQQQEYTSKDLAGLKVGHEIDNFGEEGGEQILTLKDAIIGDEDEDDELENAQMLEKEKLAEKLELKKKKPVYNPMDMDEDGEKSILKHYDEEISGKKRKRFTLNESGGGVRSEAPEDVERKRAKGVKISLDLLKDETPISDYADPSTAKIKKPKKPKKAKTARQKEVDEDDIFPMPQAPAEQNGDIAMDVDGQATQAPNGSARREVELDDDDLQRQLAEQRRAALKRRKKTDAAELARRIREEESATPMASNENGDDEEEPGMVIDETTEFVANLRRPEEQDDEPADQSIKREVKHESPEADEEGDMTMAEVMNERGDDLERGTSTPAANTHTATGFEEEESVEQGIGASLSMLRKRGLLQDTHAGDQNARDRAREVFLAENRALISEYDARAREARDRDRRSGKFERMSARERETYARQQNEQREAYLASLQAQHFAKSYKPDVKLEYTDEFGRAMNQKEAFKHLSHKFHGKGSGKQKTEKRLKKIDDEKRRESKSILDPSQGSGGMGRNLGEQARKKGTAGVRLQ